MLRTSENRQPQKTPVAAERHLDEIYQQAIKQCNISFYFCVAGGTVSLLILPAAVLGGFIGSISLGLIGGLADAMIAAFTAGCYKVFTDANKSRNTIRIKLEKVQEEERKKQERVQEEERKKQERVQEEERKKQEREQEVENKMKMLDVYCRIASKSDDEHQKEEYYHVLFGSVEYNKQRIEAYYAFASNTDNDTLKKACFREMFGSLFNF